MEITFKKYQKNDFKDLDRCEVELQDFLTKIDPLKRIRRGPGYSPKYTLNILEKVAKYDGIIFLACDGQEIVGCIAGIIEKQSEAGLLEYVPTKAGRILELFVSDAYRKHGIGKQLMEKVEDYMHKKRCDLIRIEVFEPNKNAHHFYKSLNYQDRMIDMVKLFTRQ